LIFQEREENIFLRRVNVYLPEVVKGLKKWLNEVQDVFCLLPDGGAPGYGRAKKS
jgi:hypothetical protein